MEDIKQQILNLEQQQVDAFNEGNIDRLLEFFDPGITGFSSTKHMRLGSLGELRKTFEFYQRQGSKIDYLISDPLVNIYGDTAIVTFYWIVRLRNGKKRRPIEGRGTHVYHKIDGSWKVVHEHFSRAHRSYEI